MHELSAMFLTIVDMAYITTLWSGRPVSPAVNSRVELKVYP